MPFSCIPFFACNRQIDTIDRRQCNLQAVPHDIDHNSRTLEEAYLDCNHIKDLDKPLFRCRKLKTLSLSENEIIRVPDEIANLINLEELNLKGNDVSDLPAEIKACSQLKVLDLSSNPITRLPTIITSLSSMTHLGLNDISLTQMPQDINLLRNLRSLEVRENLLRSIPQTIGQLSLLKLLDLGHNELDDLPSEIGQLSELEELYVDQNDLQTLPESIVQCRSLQQLDVSENKLMVLPDEIGDLEQLTDLTVSQNCLQVLPTSTGRLRKLLILKIDRNAITQLTSAVGSCISLSELYLTENLLTEIPSSLGNLKNLQTLNLDKNQLKEIPSTIGGCSNLTVLSIRDNLLDQLPLEVGRLEKLRVLDVCNNRLNFLPFTVNVLYNLRALWLSENQSQAMMKLQTAQDPRTGIKVLTCYLLPQSSAQQIERSIPTRSFLGGPKVHFGSDLEEAKDDEEAQAPVGQFCRQDTPHPKPHAHAPKFKKQSIDGHIIHHDEERSNPPTLALASGGRKRSSEDSLRATSPVTNNTTTSGVPRSALKHPPILPPSPPNVGLATKDVEYKTSGNVAETLRIIVRRDANGGLGLSIAGGLESTPYKDDDSGLFISKLAEGGPAESAGLRVGDKLLKVNDTDVVNVRHQVAVSTMQDSGDVIELTVLRSSNPTIPVLYPPSSSGGYVHSPNQSADMSFMSEGESSSSSKETISTTIRRDVNGSPGFSVAGGKGTSNNDVIVISAVTPGGPAERDGKLRAGDRVLSINGTNMRGARHDQAVALLTGHNGSEVYLVVQRDQALCSSPTNIPVNRSPPVPPARVSQGHRVCGFGDPSWDGRTEEVELVKDDHSLGLSIVGGSDHSSHPFGVNAPGVFISKITPNSPAARSQRLRIGDRILSVNSIDVQNARHQTAVEALKKSDRVVRLRVIHEPQPAGLREVILRRNANEALGLNICGGISSPPANPLDKTDEGIFVERVEQGGPSSAHLCPGIRILEVNDESLLGCSQEEAARILRKSGSSVRLLISDGFSTSPSMRPSTSTISQSPLSPTTHNQMQRIASNHQSPSNSSSFMSSSRVVPGPPPPVAPKPKIIPISNGTNDAPSTSKENEVSNEEASTSSIAPELPTPSETNPERLEFSSKLKKFEHEIEVKRNSPSLRASDSSPLPEKKPLLSQDEVMKLKEEEIKKVQAAGGMYQIDSAGSEKDESFEHILNDSAVPRSMPAVIRTKKAEERAKLASPSLAACTEPLNSIEQRALEHQKRQQWRQARYKSLEADSAAAEEVMLQVQQINSRLTNINEESFTSSSCSQLPLTGRVLQNDTSTNRSEYIDPITGAKTISIVETSITQREIDTTPLLQAVSSFTFVDDETSKRMNATAAVSP